MTESVDCSRKLVKLVDMFFDNSDLSDMCLHIDGQEVHLHKLLIFSQSRVFRDLFDNATDASDLYHHINSTNEHPECMQVFREFLEFFYTGKISLCTDTIVPIVSLAYKYKVLNLSASCHTYIKRYLFDESPDVDFVVNWYVHTLLQSSDFQWLRDICFEVMKRHLYHLIVSSESWHKLSFEDVFQLVSSSDVTVKEEFGLYDAMGRWLEQRYHDDPQQLGTSLQQCLQYVRFPMMSPTQLAKVQDSSLCRGHQSMYSQLLLEAYQFHTCDTQTDPDEYSRFILRDYLVKPGKLPHPPSRKLTPPSAGSPCDNGYDGGTVGNGDRSSGRATERQLPIDEDTNGGGIEDGEYTHGSYHSDSEASGSLDSIADEELDNGGRMSDGRNNDTAKGVHSDFQLNKHADATDVQEVHKGANMQKGFEKGTSEGNGDK